MPRNLLRDGWRVLMRAPESILAEIAWRWTFAAACWALLIFSFHQYLSRIEISGAEYALLKSLEPFTSLAIALRVTQALMAGFRDMGLILFPALGLLWLALATLGRAATLKALAQETGPTNLWSLLALHALRLLIAFSSLLAYFGAAVIVSRAFDPRQYYGLNVSLMLAVMLLLLTICGVVNWFVSLAQIFAAHRDETFVSSLRSAASLYQARAGDFLSSGLWFSFARLVLVVIVTLVSLAPLGNMTMAGVKGLVISLATITLVYFALADALYLWRLGVYISFTEPDREEAVAKADQPIAPPVMPEMTGGEITRSEQDPQPARLKDWNPIAEN